MQPESSRPKRPTTFLGMPAEVLAASKRGDGTHRVLKVEYRGKTVVVKCYGLKGSRLQALSRQFGSRLLLGKYLGFAVTHKERKSQVVSIIAGEQPLKEEI